ncbi:MAG: hypothetical protein KKD35_03700, partial [Elusimicrobia bacterium]|nr:hypothetical protein [Elusimicrobiota bacterium]
FENPLGKFDPTKRKASLGISMDRDIFNSDLLQIWYMKRLAEGMKYVGKDNIEEADKLKKELEREYLQMKERFPNQKLNENEIINTLGRIPKKPEVPKQTKEEKDQGIPPAATFEDLRR